MMELEINTPQKLIYHNQINSVSVPGAKGSFQILKNHAPIISTLMPGTIKVIDKNDKTIYFEVIEGIIECSNNKIVILATYVGADC
jgi:F-type H+-transporting ATPase subunit epsilon